MMDEPSRAAGEELVVRPGCVGIIERHVLGKVCVGAPAIAGGPKAGRPSAPRLNNSRFTSALVEYSDEDEDEDEDEFFDDDDDEDLDEDFDELDDFDDEDEEPEDDEDFDDDFDEDEEDL
jgi:hypothetical protein